MGYHGAVQVKRKLRDIYLASFFPAYLQGYIKKLSANNLANLRESPRFNSPYDLITFI
jgi:hypothetical protein